MSYKTVSMVAIAAVLAASASTASAQSAEGAAGNEQSPQAANLGEGDIIVTARKRDERLQDVPAAIDAVSAEEIARYATNTLDQIATRVPELIIGGMAGPGGGTITLRGVGVAGTSVSMDQAVSLNIDGIQISQSNAKNLGVYDLEHVEVLKGPQALFYGKNSLGGIISFASANPGPNLEWRARASYEFEADRHAVEGMVSVPLSDTLGVRLVAAYAGEEGFFRNRAAELPGADPRLGERSNEATDLFGRVTVRYEPSDRFDLTVKAAYASTSKDNGITSRFQTFYCPYGYHQLQAAAGNPNGVNECTLDRYYFDGMMSPGSVAANPTMLRDGVPFIKQYQFISSAQANLALTDDLTLTSVTGYYAQSEDWNGQYSGGEVEIVSTGTTLDNRQFTQELRLASSFDSFFNFMLGGFYQHSTKRDRNSLIFSGSRSTTGLPQTANDDEWHQVTDASSVFAQAILTPTEELEVTAGGRLSFETKTLRGQRYTSLQSNFSPTPVDILYDPDKVSYDDFSPEVTVRYRPTPTLMFYGAYREGFTSGGFSMQQGAPLPPVANDVTYDQARAHGFEVGMKGSAWDRQLSFDLTAYDYKFNGLQLQAIDVQSLTLKIVNAASAVTKGVELGLQLAPNSVPGFELQANVAYNDAHYIDFTNAQCGASQSIAEGCNGTFNGTRYTTQDFSGERMERAPEWVMSYGFTYDLPVSSGIDFRFGGDANYTGAFQPNPNHQPFAWQKEAWRFNAFAAIADPNGGWELSLIGRNLTNELRVGTSSESIFSGGPSGLPTPGTRPDLIGVPTEPRAVMLQLTVTDGLRF